jgi:CBS domain-containing protein
LVAKLIRDVMTSRVVTVRWDEPVLAAVERMTRFGFSALSVVTASGRLVGMVSLLDVLRFRQACGAEGAGADGRVRVREIMTSEVLSMAATANATVVAQRLRSHGELRVMPVVQGGRLVGVVTRGDLLRSRGAGSRRGGRRLFWRRDEVSEDALFALERGQRPARSQPQAATAVREVMTQDVVSVGPGEPVRLAAELMLHHRHSALPVVDAEARLIGIVSEADLLTHPLAGRSTDVTVGAVMTGRRWPWMWARGSGRCRR